MKHTRITSILFLLGVLAVIPGACQKGNPSLPVASFLFTTTPTMTATNLNGWTSTPTNTPTATNTPTCTSTCTATSTATNCPGINFGIGCWSMGTTLTIHGTYQDQMLSQCQGIQYISELYIFYNTTGNVGNKVQAIQLLSGGLEPIDYHYLENQGGLINTFNASDLVSNGDFIIYYIFLPDVSGTMSVSITSALGWSDTSVGYQPVTFAPGSNLSCGPITIQGPTSTPTSTSTATSTPTPTATPTSTPIP